MMAYQINTNFSTSELMNHLSSKNLGSLWDDLHLKHVYDSYRNSSHFIRLVFDSPGGEFVYDILNEYNTDRPNPLLRTLFHQMFCDAYDLLSESEKESFIAEHIDFESDLMHSLSKIALSINVLIVDTMNRFVFKHLEISNSRISYRGKSNNGFLFDLNGKKDFFMYVLHPFSHVIFRDEGNSPFDFYEDIVQAFESQYSLDYPNISFKPCIKHRKRFFLEQLSKLVIADLLEQDSYKLLVAFDPSKAASKKILSAL